MKPWTTQFVTSLWASGGFDGIAQLHNRELEQLKGQMNNNSTEAQLDNSGKHIRWSTPCSRESPLFTLLK